MEEKEFIIRSLDDPRIPDEYYIQIGRIAINFQLLEFQIKWLIEISMQDKGKKYDEFKFAEAKFSDLLNKLSCFNNSKEIQSTIENAKLISHKRNEIFHSFWAFDLVSKNVIREKIPYKKDFKENEIVGIEKLIDFNDKIENLIKVTSDYIFQEMLNGSNKKK